MVGLGMVEERRFLDSQELSRVIQFSIKMVYLYVVKARVRNRHERTRIPLKNGLKTFISLLWKVQFAVVSLWR